MRKELQLYIHIPFCVSKCAYCDFLSAPGKPEEVEAYLDALIKEIESHKGLSDRYQVSTVFIGGGTPSILTEMQVERLFGSIRRVFMLMDNAEITIEVNPGAVSKSLLSCYQNVGINRLSIGLQSIHQEELLILGRLHTYQDFQKMYDEARNMDFSNINVDLMSALPGQTLFAWEKTLKKVAELKPEHISAYGLILEPGTPFYARYYNRAEELPNEDQEYLMYSKTEEILLRYGYYRYEISNYAKRGCECKHNLGYWERKEYLGLGLGASSLMNELRWSNVEYIKQYQDIVMGNGNNIIEQLRVQERLLSTKEQIEETVFLGLRKIDGIKIDNFQEQIKKVALDAYEGVIVEMSEKGLLISHGNSLKLTKRGIDLSNYVMSQFLLK